MYHIKNDKRCIRSAGMISNALWDLLEVKPLSEITVSDLQKASGTGRSTFYRLFDNIDDVLAYSAGEELRELISVYSRKGWEEFSRIFFTSIVSGEKILLNIIASGKAQIISDKISQSIMQEAPDGARESDNTSKYLAAVYMGSCISLVAAWNEGGRRESIGELTELLNSILDHNAMTEIFNRKGNVNHGQE